MAVVVCSSCQLKHTARPDGICPRCKSPVEPVVVGPGGMGEDGLYAGPVPSTALPPTSSGRPAMAGARPSMKAKPVDTGMPLGLRAAGIYFVLNGIISAMTVVRNGSAAGNTGVGFGVAGISLALGAGILSGAEKAVTVAKVLSALGFGALLVFSLVLGNPFLALFMVVLAVALFSLLVGDPGKGRIAVSGVVLGSSLVFGMLLSAQNDWATEVTLRMVGQIEGSRVTELRGDKFDYTLPLGTKSHWYPAGPMMRRALGDAGDRAAFSPENRALVAVLVHRLDFSGVPIGRIADAMEVELAKNSNMEKISRDDLWGRTRGVVLHNRITEGKGKAELVQALVLRGKIFYTVQMTVPSETYERANTEFKKMLEEFDPRDVVELAQPTFDTSPTPGPPSVFEPQSQLPTHDFTKTSERRVNANP